MKIKVQKQIGKAVVVFEDEQDKGIDALFEAGFLASTPTQCSVCGSTEVQLEGSKAKGFTFVKVVCLKCFAKAQLGQYKDGGYFWKKFEQQEQQNTAPAEEQQF